MTQNELKEVQILVRQLKSEVATKYGSSNQFIATLNKILALLGANDV